MYIDFSQTDSIEFSTDVCIIGSGAAGFTCGMTFLKSGLKVLILEGGLTAPTLAATDLHRGFVVNHPHTGIHEARERVVGGTTTKWGGQAYPFLQEDFQKRDFMKVSGWPISLQELEPYYKKAEQILGTDVTVPFSYRPWKSFNVNELSFSSCVDMFVSKWCRVPNFAIQHGQKIAESREVSLMRNANVVELLPNKQKNEVYGIRIKSLNGKEGNIKARYVIAAGGAMETVRLFLASSKFHKNGLGNEYGLVGRYFQDHCAAIVGRIHPKSRQYFHELFDPFYLRGYKYLPRIKLNPAYANKLKIMHASAQIVFYKEESGLLEHSKKLVNDFRKNKKLPSLKDIKLLARPKELINMAHVAWRWISKNRGSSSQPGPVWLEVHSEQEPVYESSVTLDKEHRDALGMPRILLNWTISDLTVKTIKEMALLMKNEFESSGIATVSLDPWINGIGNPLRWIRDVYHQAGGLKMGSTAQDGVVDKNCKVFGLNNLYVASSAVFPTSSFSNPTMTTIALSIRICETITEEVKAQETKHEISLM